MVHSFHNHYDFDYQYDGDSETNSDIDSPMEGLSTMTGSPLFMASTTKASPSAFVKAYEFGNLLSNL